MESNKDLAPGQRQQLMFMAEVCSKASALGIAALERGEKLDVMKAFELALVEILQQEGRTKNQLTTLWAMLLLGSQAVKKLCSETDSYAMGRQVDVEQAEYEP
jgi:hypothetical protein